MQTQSSGNIHRTPQRVVLSRTRSLQTWSTQIRTARFSHRPHPWPARLRHRSSCKCGQKLQSILDLNCHLHASNNNTCLRIQYICLLAQSPYFSKYPPSPDFEEADRQKGCAGDQGTKNEEKLWDFSMWKRTRYCLLCLEMPSTIKNTGCRDRRKEPWRASPFDNRRPYLNYRFIRARSSRILSLNRQTCCCLEKSTKNVLLSFFKPIGWGQHASGKYLE